MAAVEVSRIATLTGHKDGVYTVIESPDPARFLSASGDGMVVLWEPDSSENGQLIASVPNSVYSICLLSDKNQVGLGHNYEGIHLIDLQEKKETGSVKITNAAIFALAYYDNILFAGTGDGDLILVDPTTCSIRGRIKKSQKSIRTLVSDGDHLAAGYSDHYIRIFQMPRLKLIHEYKAHDNSIFSLKYSPDGRYLLSGSRDARLKIWDRQNGYSLQETIIAHMYTINAIDYRADGKYFATCSMDKTVKIWDAASFKLLKVIDKSRHGGHSTSVNKIFWSSYKNRLISCSDDRTISVWDLKINALQ
jgi:WD repeat-containing protein 61